MWVNLGVFVLLWESAAVIVMTALRLTVADGAVGDLYLAGVATAPVALFATWLVNRLCLGTEDVDADEPEAVASMFAVDEPEVAEKEAAATRSARPA